MYHQHTYCRACGYAAETGPGGIKSAASGEKLKKVFDLGVQPLANDFRRPGEPRAGYAPLAVMLCPRCLLGQLSVVVDPHILYDRYSYVTSPSQTMAKHLAQLTLDLLTIKPDTKSVLEIGSNDGSYLDYLQGVGLRVEGVDPAENLCAIAAEHGIRTTQALFTAKTASTLPVSDLVIARHVFCHVDNWKDFVTGLDSVVAADGIAAIETPYVRDLLMHTQFDTVYHEHLSYLNLRAITYLLKETSLELFDAKWYLIHGGAVVLLIGRRGKCPLPSTSLMNALAAESDLEQAWLEFSNRAFTMISNLRAWVRNHENSHIAALGASAKSTVWISACGFTREDISFIADTTVQKWNTTSPGTDIPIVDEGAILRELPDYVLVWAWNYRDEIIERNQLAISKGVKFVFPIPEFEIIGKS